MRPEHSIGAGNGSDHLTIHERSWAYCPRDVRLSEHAWEQTGGIGVHDVERFARERAVKTKRADAL
jgi:hypothetical protein